MTEKIIDLAGRISKLKRKNLVFCVSCNEPIEGLTRDNIENYLFLIDGVFPAHPACYRGNVEQTMELAGKLDRNRGDY